MDRRVAGVSVFFRTGGRAMGQTNTLECFQLDRSQEWGDFSLSTQGTPDPHDADEIGTSRGGRLIDCPPAPLTGFFQASASPEDSAGFAVFSVGDDARKMEVILSR